MKTIVTWLHSILTFFSFFILLSFLSNSNTTKDQVLIALSIYNYCLVIAIVLINSTIKDENK